MIYSKLGENDSQLKQTNQENKLKTFPHIQGHRKCTTLKFYLKNWSCNKQIESNRKKNANNLNVHKQGKGEMKYIMENYKQQLKRNEIDLKNPKWKKATSD